MLDCHCHILDITNFSTETFFSSFEECQFEKIYCNTVDHKQWSSLITLSEKFPQIIPFFGFHPWYVQPSFFDKLDVLADILSKPFSYCGEIGLDRHCDIDFSLQKDMFVRQLEIAKDTKSFVAIHCVKAWGTLLEILADYQDEISFMIHSFQGSYEVMERIVAMGGMISFSDRIMMNENKKLHKVLQDTPSDNLLLETDFPFQSTIIGSSPHTYCRVLENLYSFVAKQRNISTQNLIEIIRRNGSICTN